MKYWQKSLKILLHMLWHTCLRRTQVLMETAHPVQFLVDPSQVLVDPSQVLVDPSQVSVDPIQVLTPSEVPLPVALVKVPHLVKLRKIVYNRTDWMNMNWILIKQKGNRKTLPEHVIIHKQLHLRTAVDSRRVQASAFTYECVGYSIRNRCVLLRFERSESDKLYKSINTDFRIRASHVHMFVSAQHINIAMATCLVANKYMRSSMHCTHSEKVCHCMPLC
jgi:hypothetical protein